MCIGFLKNKWKGFETTEQYLSVISGLTSISKLHNYSKNNFKYIAEKRDKWKTPIEFMVDGGGDCEDFARWYVDILVRIQEKEGARFIIYSGYNKKVGDKMTGHAVCVFPSQYKYSMFSNRGLTHNYNDYLEVGHKFYPDGLKILEVRGWQGKVLQRKFKIFGTF